MLPTPYVQSFSLGSRCRSAPAVRRTVTATLLGIVTVISFGACDNPASVDSPGIRGSPLHDDGLPPPNTAAGDTTYPHFAADVTVQVSGAAAAGAGKTRTFQYHVDRVRKAGSKLWKSTHRFTSDPSWGLPATAAKLAATNVATQVVRNPLSSTSPVQLYNSAGQSLPLPSATMLQQQLHISAKVIPTAPAPMPHSHPPAGLGGSTMPTGGPLASPANVVALQAALAQSYQPKGTGSDGSLHYTRATGDTTVDLALNPTVGQVQQVTATRAGAVVLQRSYTFTRLANGMYVRTGMRTQQMRAGSNVPVVTTITYSNMVFDHAGGQ